jgi:hypothetical protein
MTYSVVPNVDGRKIRSPLTAAKTDRPSRLFPFLGRRYNGKQNGRPGAQQGEQHVPSHAAGDESKRAES